MTDRDEYYCSPLRRSVSVMDKWQEHIFHIMVYKYAYAHFTFADDKPTH